MAQIQGPILSIYNLLLSTFLKKFFTLPADGNVRVAITRSESFNHHAYYSSDKAHDGNYERSRYSPKDGAMAGNFLKLYLSQAYSIGDVIMFCRAGKAYADKMINTEVRVYSTVSGENDLVTCGIITGTSYDFFRRSLSLAS